MLFNFRGGVLQRADCQIVKGVCMIAIILHHISNQYLLHFGQELGKVTSFLLGLTGTWGYLGTGVFFLLSGFGLHMSLNKNGYSHRYLYSHLWNLLKPFLVIYLLDTIVYSFTEGRLYYMDAFNQLVTISIAHKDTWFLKVIILLYIVTISSFAIHRKSKCRILLLICICAIYILVTKDILRLSNKWYISVLNFPLGFIIGGYYAQIQNLLGKKANFIALFAATFVISFVFAVRCPGNFIIIRSLIFSIFTILAITLVRINSKTLTYIGKHSIYYYLGHYIIIYTLFNYVCHYPLILTILAFATPTAISLIVSKAQYNKKIIY
jgi:hypothetical protein